MWPLKHWLYQLKRVLSLDTVENFSNKNREFLLQKTFWSSSTAENFSLFWHSDKLARNENLTPKFGKKFHAASTKSEQVDWKKTSASIVYKWLHSVASLLFFGHLNFTRYFIFDSKHEQPGGNSFTSRLLRFPPNASQGHKNRRRRQEL